MSTSPTKRPTIAELEAILNDPNPGTISIAPDGSMHVLPHGMARESQAEVDSLRASNASLRLQLQECAGVLQVAEGHLYKIREYLDDYRRRLDRYGPICRFEGDGMISDNIVTELEAIVPMHAGRLIDLP